MIQLLQESVALVNLPYTMLFGLMVLYWIVYALGLISSEMFSADTDVDVSGDLGHADVGGDLGHADIHGDFGHADVGGDLGHADLHGADLHGDLGHADVGAHADVDAGGDFDHGHADAGGLGSTLGAVLSFFHVGQVPLMLLVSILIAVMWTTSMTVNHLLGNQSLLLSLLLAVPVLATSLAVTKVVVWPFAPLFRKLFDTSGDRIRIVGRSCTIRSQEATPEFGQAELATAGAPVVLNVKTPDGVTLHQGDQAIIFDYDAAAGVYLVNRFEMPS